MTDKKPVALVALDVAPRTKPSNYPEPFASMMAGRMKRQLGDQFGLENFGVNLTVIAPGGMSALRHAHSKQDVVYLEVGDRSAGDEVSYPDDDIAAKFIEGKWKFFHKDGKSY